MRSNRPRIPNWPVAPSTGSVARMRGFDSLPQAVRDALNDARAPYSPAYLRGFLDGGVSVDQVVHLIASNDRRISQREGMW